MTTDPTFSIKLRLIALATAITLLSGCAVAPVPRAVDPVDVAAANDLQKARSVNFSDEERVGHYLDAAALTAPRLGSGKEATPAREIYNSAAAELTIFLKSEENGKLWNQSLTITGEKTTYHLHLQPSGPGVWSPDYFTTFRDPNEIKRGLIKTKVTQDGVGGALVGVRSAAPPERFAPIKGMAAAVTTTLDFHGSDAVLTLQQSSNNPRVRVQGKERPLSADFSAPISYFRPPNNLLLFGMMGTLRGANMMEKTGLYFLEPYDPDRIPVVFVHGLASTPFTWVRTINGLQQDPEVRKRYQPWVFSYATGNPILYSALRLREELTKVDKAFPDHKAYVLVGHSMGGILSQLQVTNVSQSMWEKETGDIARGIFSRNSHDSLVVRAMTFRANPRIKRVVFVCTPHRGSNMASSGIGRFGISLITLPFAITSSLKGAITGAELERITGSAKRMPNSVSGLKPTNPTFKVVNKEPMTAPYHTILGDRGKGNSPNSTDGVVAYWSSHFDGAKSERVVPGPHGSCELPETIAELNRILKLHLASSN